MTTKKYNVQFGSDTTGISRGVNQVSSKLKGLDRIASKLAVGIGGAFAGFAVAGQVKDVIDYGDKLQKLSLRLGETTEDFSRMAHVGELSGVAFDSMTMALQRMQRRVAEAAQGTGEAKNALKELGINAKALAKLSLDEQFQAIAQRISETADAGDKTRLAMKLFDSEGVKLIQTMGGGADGIREMMAEADALGKTVSTETANDMAHLNDTFTRLEARTSAASLQLTTSLLPAIETAANLFISAADAASRFFGELSGASFDSDAVLKFSQRSEEDLKKLLARTKERISEFEAQRENPSSKGIFDTAGRELSGLTADLKNIQAAIDKISKTASDTGAGGIASTFTAKQTTAQIKAAEAAERGAASARTKAASAAAAELKRLASEGASVINSVRSPTEILGARITELDGLLNQGVISWDVYGKAVAQAGAVFNAESLENSAERLQNVIQRRSEILSEGASITESLRTPAEVMGSTIEDLNRLVNAGAITWQTYGRAAKNAREEFDEITTKGEEQRDVFDELTSAVNGWGNQFAQTLLSSEGKFSDFIGSILNQLAQIAISQSTQPLFDMFGSFVKQSVKPAAYGGSVTGGSPYLIGEQGPEMFVPGSSGTIIPNHKMSGGYNPTFNISGNGIDRQFVIAAMQQSTNEMKAYIQNDFSNRGRLSRAL